MSLWRFTDRPLQVGAPLDGYFVTAIKQAVPVSVQVRNYDARMRNCPEEPEELRQCVQLGGGQLTLFP